MLKRLLIAMPVLVAGAAFVLYSSCGGDEPNVLRPIAEPTAANNKDAKLEKARILMDQRKYDAAANLLEPMVDGGSNDSNEARLLFAAAELGVAELDIWTIINNVLEAQDENTKDAHAKGGGLDTVFDAISDSVLGTGDARQAKIEALVSAINTLEDAPDPDSKQIKNTQCLFAGILAVPTLADAKAGLDAVQTALQSIRDSSSNAGNTCPNIGLLDTASAAVSSAAANFSLILKAAANCSFLNFDKAAATMNTIETQMRLLTANTDKGCAALPDCPAALPSCHDLFPQCVKDALEVGTSSAVAGDGIISSCELVLNCTVSKACFK